MEEANGAGISCPKLLLDARLDEAFDQNNASSVAKFKTIFISVGVASK